METKQNECPALELHMNPFCEQCIPVIKKLGTLGLDYIARTYDLRPGADMEKWDRLEKMFSIRNVPVFVDRTNPKEPIVKKGTGDILKYLNEHYSPKNNN